MYFLIVPIFILAAFRSPFTWANLLFAAAAFAAAAPFIGRRKALTAVSLATVALWVSLWLSRRALPPVNDIHAIVAVGGFPFTAFRYPVPPMGSDVPPLEQWPWFFLNYAVFVAVAWFMVHAFDRAFAKKFSAGRPAHAALHASSIGIALLGFAYTLLAFD